MIFIASPYSSPSPAVRQARYEAARAAAARLAAAGRFVYSPIVHSHVVCAVPGAPPWDAVHWYEAAMDQLRRANEVWVLTTPGWQTSRGVAAEVSTAQVMGLPVRVCDPATLSTQAYRFERQQREEHP